MAQKIIDGKLYDTFLVRGEDGQEVPVEVTGEVEIKNAEGHAIPVQGDPEGLPVAVEPLGTPGVARQLNAGATSASVALSAECTRVSLYARLAAVRFVVGVGAQTATATSHYLDVGTGIDIRVPAGATIAAIKAGDVSAVLEISELI